LGSNFWSTNMDNDKKAKIIKRRKQYGGAFLALGTFLLCVVIFRNALECFSFIATHKWQILWCAAAAFMGMGAGIINSRDHGSERHTHYWVYFVPFVFPIATIAGFVAGLIADKSEVIFYLVSFLVSLSVGFSGDALAGKVEDLGLSR